MKLKSINKVLRKIGLVLVVQMDVHPGEKVGEGPLIENIEVYLDSKKKHPFEGQVTIEEKVRD
jgi:hypothetical protein